jgi:hypothetical protein
MIQVGIGHAGHQIGRPWPERGQTNSGFSGQSPIDIGHERGTLLMTRRDKSNPRAEDGVHYIERFLTGYTKHELHTFVFETAYQQIGSVHGIPSNRAN